MIRLIPLFLLVACQHYKAVQPDGFAAFKSSGEFRAASADGVIFRVREAKNKPEAELAFWKEALSNRMRDAGYTFLSDGEIKAAKDHPGYLIALSAPVGPVDYSYLVSVFVSGSQVVIAEAAGDVTKLEAHKAAILAAMSKLEID